MICCIGYTSKPQNKSSRLNSTIKILKRRHYNIIQPRIRFLFLGFFSYFFVLCFIVTTFLSFRDGVFFHTLIMKNYNIRRFNKTHLHVLIISDPYISMKPRCIGHNRNTHVLYDVSGYKKKNCKKIDVIDYCLKHIYFIIISQISVYNKLAEILFDAISSIR